MRNTNREAPTKVPCPCCAGSGMVTLDVRAVILIAHPELATPIVSERSFALDDPALEDDEPPPSAA